MTARMARFAEIGCALLLGVGVVGGAAGVVIGVLRRDPLAYVLGWAVIVASRLGTDYLTHGDD